MSCQRENGIREVIKICIIIHKNSKAKLLFEKGFITVSELEENLLGINTSKSKKKMPWGLMEVINTNKTWLKTSTEGDPNLCQALGIANDMAVNANNLSPKSMPPLIINLCETIDENLIEIEKLIKTIKKQSNNIGNTFFLWFLINKNTEQLNSIKKLTSFLPLTDESRNIKTNSKINFICFRSLPYFDNFSSENYTNGTIIHNPENLIYYEQ